MLEMQFAARERQVAPTLPLKKIGKRLECNLPSEGGKLLRRPLIDAQYYIVARGVKDDWLRSMRTHFQYMPRT